MLTRKYYKAIAEAISNHTCFERLGEDNDTKGCEVIAKDDFINTLCRLLIADNPNFDPTKFKEACR